MLVLAELRVTATDACLYDPCTGRALLCRALPSNPIRVVERLAVRRKILRYPIGNDVVVRFIGRAELKQLDAPRTPRTDGLDPCARAQLVARFGIFIAAEASIPLHQAEAFQLPHRERRRQWRLRIQERTPDPLALAGRDHQTVGVVHFRAKVGSMRLILAEEIHARERSHAQRRNFIAQIEARSHAYHGLLARMNVELVRAARARRIEQRIDSKRLRIRCRLHEPELAEARKLLAAAADGVDRQTARGETVALTRAECPKVARAQEHDELVLVLLVVQWIVRAKSREAEVAPLLRRELILAVVEIRAAILDVAHALRGHFVDEHRLHLELAQMKEHHLERHLRVAP